mmetsp:Transcript_72837/g.116189  ORF Transcript_72837/g.116189 Transcript_72837/m.116189 type:complete len:224 (-) Transcript_72837:96-767(-)
MADWVDVTSAKSICPYLRTIVWGYIRDLAVQYSFDYTPNLIVSVCLLYYHEPARFCKHGECMKLSNDNKTVSMSIGSTASSYCYSESWIAISPHKSTNIHVHIDHIGINPTASNNNLIIGIATNDEIVDDDDDCFDHNFYGYSGDKIANSYLQTDDTVMIRLSAQFGIQFFVNEELKKEITYFDAKSKYKAVAVMWNKQTQVTLRNITYERITDHCYAYCSIL